MNETLERSKHLATLERLRSDFRLFAETCLWIVTKEHGLRRLHLNFAQTHVLGLLEQQYRETGRIRVIILKARQEGISTFIAAWFVWHVWLNAWQTGLVVADELDRAGKIFSIYERFAENAPLGLPKQRRAQHARELAWDTDSAIGVDTARDVNVGRGSTIHQLHLSELGSWPATEKTDAQKSFSSVEETVPRLRSSIAIESTAQGYGNLFHTLWEQAVEHGNDYLAIFLPWFIHEEYSVGAWEVTEELRFAITNSRDPFEREAQDVGIYWGKDVSGDDQFHKLTVEQLAWRRAKIRGKNETLEHCPDFTQENPATADEAFLVSGGAFFDALKTKALDRATKPIRPERRELVAGKLQRADRGNLSLFEPPGDAHYVIGADTAKGRMVASRTDDERGGRDYCSADVLKIAQWVEHPGTKAGEAPKWVLEPCRVQVAHYHGHFAPEVFAEGLWFLGLYYSCKVDMADKDRREPALVGIERNHESGATAIRWMRDKGYPRLYRKRSLVTLADKRPTIQFGFWTDEGSRRVILDTFATYVREEISGVANNDTVKEMLTFVSNDEGKPEAQQGTHDDRVLSYAIALEMERFHTHAAREVPEAPKARDTPTGR